MLAFESSFGVPAGPLMASLRKDTEKPAALAEAGIAVVCQFGVMFFADTIRAYRAVLRVLKSGGRFVFDVWDKIEETSLPAWLLRRVSAAYEVDKGGHFEPWEQPDRSLPSSARSPLAASLRWQQPDLGLPTHTRS